jgi:hypothetical protein
VLSRSFVPLALITLGVFFLLGNMIQGPGRGGLIMLGLGVAFAIGRVTTGRYGYSVPAGILIAIGTYVSAQEIVGPLPLQSSGWFFVLLGLGFVLSYVIGMRPSAIWPLFPATVLIGLGLLLFGWAASAPIASLAWIVGYWPIALVLVGVWLLFRDQLPTAIRQPVATLGGIVLLGYGLLAAVASVASAGSLARTDFGFHFGSAPYTDTFTVDHPIASGETFSVINSSGRTSIKAGQSNPVHVVATRHFSEKDQPPTVNLTPGPGTLHLEMTDTQRAFGHNSSVDYVVEVPADVQVKATSSSGALELSGINGAVQAEASSGGLELTNIGGELRAKTSSGRLRGTGLLHVRDVQSSSGAITLNGVFNEAARVQSTSGRVEVTFAPGSAVQVEVRTTSGDIRNDGVLATKPGRNTLSGPLGTPAAGATLSIQTTSGSVSLKD